MKFYIVENPGRAGREVVNPHGYRTKLRPAETTGKSPQSTITTNKTSAQPNLSIWANVETTQCCGWARQKGGLLYERIPANGSSGGNETSRRQ